MRFRLYPSAAQKVLLLEQCAHARYVWNLGLEQRLMWRRWQGPAPGFNAQAAQLTQARQAEPWLACGSQTVQQQALRDLDQAWRQFFAGTHRRPRWRKAGEDEGLRIVGPQALRVRQDNRARSSVLVPKIGWVPFKRSQTCNACKHIAAESRKSQAIFVCVACGHRANADVNAARNIAAGHAVAARGDRRVLARSVKREPQHARPPKVA